MQNIDTLTKTIETSTDPTEILAAETALAKLRAEQRAATNRARLQAEESAAAQAEERRRLVAAKGAEVAAARSEHAALVERLALAFVEVGLAARAAQDASRQAATLANEHAELAAIPTENLDIMPSERTLADALKAALTGGASAPREDIESRVREALRGKDFRPFIVNGGLTQPSRLLPVMSQRTAFDALGLSYREGPDRSLRDRVEAALSEAGRFHGAPGEDRATMIAETVTKLRGIASERGMTLAEVE